MRNVCLTSIRAIRSLATNVRSGSGRRARGIIPGRPMGPLSAMAMSVLLPVPDDDHCVVCPTCETLVAQRFSGDRCGANTKKAGWSRSLARRA
jgi:hypothetical protein